ncbi:hypothetical protein HPY86_06115 [candidate division WOR-3 bacterium]|nr:hypothetical protein [candidate division WOR-3 bacterium]
MLVKRFRIIKTTRPAPNWLNLFSYCVFGLVFVAIILVLLFQGYRLSFGPIVSLLIRLLVNIAGLGILTEIILNKIIGPSVSLSRTRQIFDYCIAILLIPTLIFQRLVLPLLVLYQMVNISMRLSRASFATPRFGNLRQHPVRLLVLGFVAAIAIGTLLLTLPHATTDGRGASLLTALFTATSAISTTGLTVVNIESYYTLLGQLVILFLVQIGGVGYMAFIGFAMLGITGRLSVNLRTLFRESIAQPFTLDVKRFVRAVVAITLLFEVGGALLLFVEFSRYFPLTRALYWSIFHSVSAFCTAGFTLGAGSFIAYRNSLLLNFTIALLCLAGSLGFFVIFDFYQWCHRSGASSAPHRLSTHSKLALTTTGILILSGTLFILFADWQPPQLTIVERVLTASFQSISAATTTGFNTVDIGGMTSTSLFLLLLLMFIGASPGGTGGGIKTTTFSVLFLSLSAHLRNRKSPVVFQRRINSQTVSTAAAIATAFLLWGAVTVLILTSTEMQSSSRLPQSVNFLALLFETISALGTVGLSTGITAQLSVLGKLLLIFTMFFGRVGPFALTFALVGTKKTPLVAHPEADIIVG